MADLSQTEVDDALEALLAAETAADFKEWETHHELNEDLFTRFMLRLNFLVHDHRAVANRTIDYLLVRAEEQDNKNWQGRLYLGRSHIHVNNGAFAQALELANTAISIFQTIGNKPREAKACFTRLMVYTRTGMLKEALAEIAELEPIVQAVDDPSTSKMFATTVGLIYHNVGRFDEAVRWWQEGIDLSLAQSDPGSACSAYGNLAAGLIYLQRIDEALELFERTISYANRHGLMKIAALAVFNRAHLFFLQGRYRDAVEALKATRLDFKHDEYEVASLDLLESEIHLESNLFDKAIAIAQSANEVFIRLGARNDVARALMLQGFAQGRRGNLQNANSLLGEARATFVDQMDDHRLARVDLYRAQLLFQSGCIPAAREVAEQARTAFDKEKVVAKAAYARMLIARCMLRENDLAGAWETTHEAARLSQQAQLPWLSYQLHQLVGDLHDREGNPKQAHGAYLEALSELEKLRGNLTQEESRLSFAYDKEQLFESLMKTCFDLNGPQSTAEAFDSLEKAKSRTLADLLTRSVSVVCGNAFVREAESAFNGDPFLRLYESDAASAKPISLREIQKTLEPETALIEYFILNGKIGAFVLRQDGMEVARELGELSDVQRSISLLDFQLSRFRLGDAYIRSNRKNLNETVSMLLRRLHATLFQPLEKWLDGRSKCLIVPHGVLHRVPFHLLTDGERYVIDRFAVSYAPSATVYEICARRRSSESRKPLIVGVADTEIPGVVEEIANLHNLWSTAKILQDETATLSNFRSESERANIIHIATHADFRQDNAMFSSIRLADGWMNVADIYGLNMNADLVALSGCGTGRGALRSGDEIVGLVRGFLYAGARCLLVSLWDVHDGSTSRMMGHFYKHVASGSGFAEALRLAMLATREEEPHPYYWGSFRLVGYVAPSLTAPV